ncbi:MAG: YkvA family protein [Candidatus Limnocylindria bacterium]
MQWVAVAAAALVLVWLGLVLLLVALGRRALARELATIVPNLTRLFAGLVRDPRVPLRAKIALGAAGAYLALPIDLVPDFIPIAGSLDDAIVAAFALRYVVRASSAEIVAEHWPGDPATLRRILRLARA